MLLVNFKRVRDVQKPSRAYSQPAGWDFYVPDLGWESKTIQKGESLMIPSGIQIKMKQGWAMRFDNKSGIALLGLLVGASIVDADYQGEIHLNVWNVSNCDVIIRRGQKLLQGIFFEVPQIEMHETTGELFDKPSDRGEAGFGSTQTK
jgi:dUTP pyrophosphatase